MSSYEYTSGKNLNLKEEQEKTLKTPVLKANFILNTIQMLLQMLWNPDLFHLKFLYKLL